MILFDLIGLDIGYVLIGMMVFCIILFILVVILFSMNKKLKKKYMKFMIGATGQSLEDSFTEKFDELKLVKNDVEEAKNHLEKIDRTLLNTYQKLGIVKYDAFEEIGGQLSFALALLTQTNNGFLINCVHSSREGCYTYIKEIKNGQASVMLSEEENRALEAAKNNM